MNVHIDRAIFDLQPTVGGISLLWSQLQPALARCGIGIGGEHPDWFISTYYQQPPFSANGAKPPRTLVMVYDCIHEMYQPLRNAPDRYWKATAIMGASAIVAISHSAAMECYRYYRRQASVAYPGADHLERAMADAAETFRMKYNLVKPYFLLVGRRGGYKNVEAVYQAWALAASAPHHALVAVGGEEPARPEATFAARFPDTFRHLRLDPTELATAYSAATALIYPSLYEGFGLPVAEAMRCGCAVICGRGGSLEEIGGDAPFYADVTKPRELAAAMDMTAQPGERVVHQLRGYMQAKRFTWDGMAASIAEVLRMNE